MQLLTLNEGLLLEAKPPPREPLPSFVCVQVGSAAALLADRHPAAFAALTGTLPEVQQRGLAAVMAAAQQQGGA